MSISFKINKIFDSSNKPTVFERLGMKSSKSSICPSFLKTGKCQQGSKCPYEHKKKSVEELLVKSVKDDASKGNEKEAKTAKNKKEDSKAKNSPSKKTFTGDDTKGGLLKHSSDGKSNKESSVKESEGEKRKSQSSSSLDKIKKKENEERFEKRHERKKNATEDDKKHGKAYRHEDKKRSEQVDKHALEDRDKGKKEVKVERGGKLERKEKLEREEKMERDVRLGERKKRRKSSESSRSSRGQSSSRGRRGNRSSKGNKKSRNGEEMRSAEGMEGLGSGRKENQKFKDHLQYLHQSKHPLLLDPRKSPSLSALRNHHSLTRKNDVAKDEYVLRDKGGRESMRESRKSEWEQIEDVKKMEEESRYRSQRMDRSRVRKECGKSEERYMDGDSYRGVRHYPPSSRPSPPLFSRSKRERSEGEREAYPSSDDSLRNYGYNNPRRSGAYKGSLRRNRSRSSGESRRGPSRYYEKSSSATRARMITGPNLMLPSHNPPIQPLPPPPSTYDFPYSMPHPPLHSDLHAPGKLMVPGKIGMHHGGPWEGRMGGGRGLFGDLPHPPFRAPMPHSSYRPPIHHLPLSNYRFENRMPLPMTPNFPPSVQPLLPMEDVDARKILKLPYPPHNQANKETEAVKAEKAIEKERECYTAFKIQLYEDVSEDELAEMNEEGKEKEENNDADVGDDNDLSDVDRAYLSMPKKIALVETMDVDWSMLSGVERKAVEKPALDSRHKNCFDEIGLSRRLAGDELYKEITELRSKSENNNKVENVTDKCAFWDEVALYHVSEEERRKKVEGVCKLVGGLEQALHARKDLLARRTLCDLNKEEEILYPGRLKKSDIYKDAVILFEENILFLTSAAF